MPLHMQTRNAGLGGPVQQEILTVTCVLGSCNIEPSQPGQEWRLCSTGASLRIHHQPAN